MADFGNGLYAVALLLLLVGIVAALNGARQLQLALSAVGSAVCIVASVLTDGNELYAAMSTATFIWSAWQWWNGGGGDGTRRRLRRLAGHFHGVRRTAPTT
ncbi:hypothetical protein [Streptomyces alfalfae]